MHKLLERQVRKLGPVVAPQGFEQFLAAVDAAYVQADRDREMVERSLELASQELLERNRQLRVDIERRKQLEIELSQAEKLRAVGQLASGIAHELNTPIQYVGDNVIFLKRAFEAFAKLIDGALKLETNAKLQKELTFFRDNVPDSIESALEGCSRVGEIVGAMKEFAHPDGEGHACADINRAVACTVAMARNVVRYVAEVELDLGELPDVQCRIGDLNQVFLNLIVNAAHAIEDGRGAEGTRGRIGVSTRRRDDRVIVEVTDDGCGIPEAIQSKLFEPFFTTKEVGRGTGQGLAISRSIVVDKHGGALHFRTTPGKGTTFTVEIPITGATDSSDTKHSMPAHPSVLDAEAHYARQIVVEKRLITALSLIPARPPG
jgi:two-component system, NtrC family, sensor kinase